MTLDHLISALPGFLPFAVRSPGPNGIALKGPYGEWLSQRNGAIAFGGALRLFSRDAPELRSIAAWNAADGWLERYGALAPRWTSIAEDAFGVQFLLSPDGREVAIFWSETGETEEIGVSISDFFEAMRTNPDETIDLSSYQAACAVLGIPNLDEHVALKVARILGGELAPSNMERMPAQGHMRALGSIAVQIEHDPLGTQYKPVQGD